MAAVTRRTHGEIQWPPQLEVRLQEALQALHDALRLRIAWFAEIPVDRQLPAEPGIRIGWTAATGVQAPLTIPYQQLNRRRGVSFSPAPTLHLSGRAPGLLGAGLHCIATSRSVCNDLYVGSTGSAVFVDDNSRSRRFTFAEAIERVADGEPISAIIIGSFGWGDSPDEEQEQITSSARARIGQLLTWEEARPMLDYEFNAGFGSPECHPIYAWTQRKVLFILEWDGSTGVLAVPRNPTLVNPTLLDVKLI